jgi:hypothetical protein
MQLRRGTKPVLVKEPLTITTVGDVSFQATMWKELGDSLTASATIVEEEPVAAGEPLAADEPTEVPYDSLKSLTSSSDSPKKTKRVRKMPEYKSIVRTRSQKLKEAEVYHEKMLDRLSSHWHVMRREPKIDSPYGDEAELATYIQNLRDIHPENLKPEFVARVTEALPWFKWHVPAKTTWCGTLTNLAAVGGLVAVAIGAVYMQVKLQDRENTQKIIMMLNEIRNRMLSYA